MTRFHFKCKDIGLDCSFEADSAERKDLLPKIKMHARYAHGYFDVPEDLLKKIDESIREE